MEESVGGEQMEGKSLTELQKEYQKRVKVGQKMCYINPSCEMLQCAFSTCGCPTDPPSETSHPDQLSLSGVSPPD